MYADQYIFASSAEDQKGLFTLSVSIDANVATPVDAWKEHIDTLISIETLTPIISISINTSIKIK